MITLVRLTPLFVALVASSGVNATIINGIGGASIEYVSGGAVIADGSGLTFQGRTWMNPAVGSSNASIAETYAARVGGNEIAITAARTVAIADIAAAAAAVAAAGIAGVQVGAAISHAIGNDDVHIGNTYCTATYGGWKCQDPVPAVTSQGTVYSYGVGGWFASMSAACSAYGHGQGGTAVGVVQSNNWCYAYNADGVQINSTSLITDQQTNKSCPASVDALNPAWSVSEGSPPDANGKCPTGRYNAVSPEQAATRIAEGVPHDGWDKVAEAVQDAGGDIKNASERSLTGPASKTGSPTTTTTTGPDGVTTSTTQPTTSYTYNDNRVTYNVTNTVTTTGPNGTTTTVTTEGGDKPDPADQCAKHPDTLGCAKFGEVGTDAPQWQPKTITYQPEDLGMAGSCPAPEVINLTQLGATLTWSYQPACDVAPIIRLGLLALCAMGCLLWILSTVKQ